MAFGVHTTSTGQQHQHHQAVVQIEYDLRSEISCDENGILTIKLINLIENLTVIGMNCLDNWEKGLNYMKTYPDVTYDPLLFQVWYTLNQYTLPFTHMYTLMRIRLVSSSTSIQSPTIFGELIIVTKPLLNIKTYRDTVYSYNTVQKDLTAIRLTLMVLEGTVSKSSKNRKVTEESNKYKQNKRVSSTSDSSFGSSSSDLEYSDRFRKLFHKSKPKNVVIQQTVQYNNGRKRHISVTTGDTRTHLVKIDISDTEQNFQ